MALDTRYQRLPFTEAITFLKGKITLDTDRYDDIRDDEADAFFTVAGAKGSLLAEMRSAVEDAIERGQRPADFRARFAEIAEGWAGNNDWRADLIYKTNLRTAYARGREEYQLDPDVLLIQPYLQFIHGDAIVPRPHHQALDGQVFRAENVPFALPNGYGCGCRYVSLSERDMQREGLSVSTLSRGAIVGGVPLEPEPGWDRMPGASRDERRQDLVQRVIDRAGGAIGQAVQEKVEEYAEKSKGQNNRQDLRELVANMPRLDRINTTKAWLESNLDPNAQSQKIKRHGMAQAEDMKLFQWEGIKFYYSDETKASLAASLADIAARPAFPDRVKAGTESIVFTTQKNKSDSYWAKKYNQPNFVSAATGGDKQVVVYSKRSAVYGTVVHEAGHSIAAEVYGSATPPLTSDFAETVRLEKEAPSRYAKVAIAEDFAESVRLYVDDPRAFKQLHPQRFAVIDKILNDKSYKG